LTIVCGTHYNTNQEVRCMDERSETLANLVSELRRGTVVLSVLSRLSGAVYGYSLVQDLSDRGIEVEANTLYPLLRRLEKQGLLSSEWETDSGKPRKYYMRTPEGTRMYEDLIKEWDNMVEKMNTLLEGGI